MRPTPCASDPTHFRSHFRGAGHEHYNHQRYQESLNNATPADAYFGRASAIIKKRERIRRQTIEYLRLQHRKLAA